MRELRICLVLAPVGSPEQCDVVRYILHRPGISISMHRYVVDDEVFLACATILDNSSSQHYSPSDYVRYSKLRIHTNICYRCKREQVVVQSVEPEHGLNIECK